MGVTYKLKNEIIDYILQKKRENPRISCRQLTMIVEEKFHVKLSKSSVGVVIKEANLSSPIGRPTIPKNPAKKFKIPQEKKKLLFGNEEPLIRPETISEKCDVSKAAAKLSVDDFRPHDKDDDSADADQCLFGSGRGSSVLENALESSRSVERVEKTVVFDDGQNRKSSKQIELGRDLLSDEVFEAINWKPFVLRLAFWDFFRGPVLEDFFKRQTALSQREIEMIDVLICLFPEVLYDATIVSDKGNLWLWKIIGWDDFPQIEEIDSVLKYLKEFKIKSFDFDLELAYFFTMISAVKIVLENDREMVLDGRLRSVNFHGNQGEMCPVERAIYEVANFLTGKKILTVTCADHAQIFNVLEVIIEFCEQRIPIKKLQLLDEDNLCFLEYAQNVLPMSKFILTTQMTTDDFGKMFGDVNVSSEKIIRKKEEYLCSDREIKTPTVNFGNNRNIVVRVVTCRLQEDGLMSVFITNMLRNELSVEKFVESAFGNGDAGFLCEIRSESKTVLDMFKDLETEAFLSEKLSKVVNAMENYFYKGCRESCENAVTNCNNLIYINHDTAWSIVKFKIMNDDGLIDENKLKKIVSSFIGMTYNSKEVVFV